MKVRDLYLSTKHPNYQLARFVLDKESSTTDEPEVVEILRDTIPTIAELLVTLAGITGYYVIPV
jgi:hypothetical protein